MQPVNQSHLPTSAPAQLALQQNKVLRNTYLLLALTLIPTALGAVIGTNLNFSFMRSYPIASAIGVLVCFYFMIFLIEKNRNSSLGVGLLLLFTLGMGVLLGPLFQHALGLKNGTQLISMAALGTAGVFFGMATIATTTKRNLSFMSNFIVAGVIVVMLAVVANIFIQSPMFHLVLCAVFILLCSAIILYQVNAIVTGGETNYVSATLTLYVSIYNIFSSLLQLLMAFTGERD